MSDQEEVTGADSSVPPPKASAGRAVTVATSIGQLFAHPLKARDMDVFKTFDVDTQEPERLRELGGALLRRLVRVESADDGSGGIPTELYERLSTQDIEALARGAAEACRLEPLPGEASGPEELAAALLKKFADGAASIQQTLEQSFSSLSASVQSTLGERLRGLSATRDALKGSSAVGAVLRALEDQERILKKMKGPTLPTIEVNLPKIGAAFNGLPKMPSVEVPPPLSLPEIQLPPFEQTATGRAALAGEESARQLREVAGCMGAMADNLAGLHEVFLTQVIPKWKEELEEGTKATTTTLQQAERNIKLAKWALVASVVATVLMTCWQLWIARAYKLEADSQQDRMEHLMTAQLEESRKANQRLADDAKQLRESLARAASAAAPAVTNVPARKGDGNAKRSLGTLHGTPVN